METKLPRPILPLKAAGLLQGFRRSVMQFNSIHNASCAMTLYLWNWALEMIRTCTRAAAQNIVHFILFLNDRVVIPNSLWKSFTSVGACTSSMWANTIIQ